MCIGQMNEITSFAKMDPYVLLEPLSILLTILVFHLVFFRPLYIYSGV